MSQTHLSYKGKQIKLVCHKILFLSISLAFLSPIHSNLQINTGLNSVVQFH